MEPSNTYRFLYQCLKLSALAAQTLADAKLISLQTLKLHSKLKPFTLGFRPLFADFRFPGPKEYKVRKKVVDPLTGAGGANAMFWTLTNPMKFGSFLQ